MEGCVQFPCWRFVAAVSDDLKEPSAVVTNCNAEPVLQDPIKDPARFLWHEVTKVAHYWLEVDALLSRCRRTSHSHRRTGGMVGRPVGNRMRICIVGHY